MRESYTNPSKTKRIEQFQILGLTNRIHDTNLLKKVYESNLGYKSLRFGFANRDSQVQTSRNRKDLDLGICIFKDLFCAIVLRIRKDLLDS